MKSNYQRLLDGDTDLAAKIFKTKHTPVFQRSDVFVRYAISANSSHSKQNVLLIPILMNFGYEDYKKIQEKAFAYSVNTGESGILMNGQLSSSGSHLKNLTKRLLDTIMEDKGKQGILHPIIRLSYIDTDTGKVLPIPKGVKYEKQVSI